MRIDLPAELRRDVDALVADWQAGSKVDRLWDGDESLWTGADEAEWLGWLHVPAQQLARRDELAALRDQARAGGFEHVLVLGMGGSSLCPEVLALTFGPGAAGPRLHILDSTDPEEVAAREREAPPDRTLYVVSSKSGSTLEPSIFMRYFAQRVADTLGAEQVGGRFVAITDPGSALEDEARTQGFRAVVHGVPSIGGRYSALSAFGMVPGALAGIDVAALLGRAEGMAARCGPDTPAAENPGLLLGAVLGAAHDRGRDKLTLVTSPGVAAMGAWLEQLLAESTGKQGKGIVPVDGEPLGEPDVYGEDRVFAQLRLEGDTEQSQDAALDALAEAGHPVIRIDLADTLDLGGQFFQWELATAVAGAVIGVNPFDQPDVEAAKVKTRELTAAYERTGALSPAEAAAPADAAGLLEQVRPGDYVALLAFLPRDAEHERRLTAIRTAVRDRRRAATCVGFGPRYLHSTGQAHKGGPPSGVFLQLTREPSDDIAIPGVPYTFGVVQEAQARGDLDVLAERGRRVLHVDVGPDTHAGLERLQEAVAR